MEATITDIREARAEKLLREYVRIRHNLEGEERIIAIVEWAANVDELYAAANDHRGSTNFRGISS